MLNFKKIKSLDMKTNKINKYVKRSLVLAIFMGTFSGCSNLEEEAYSFLTTDNFYTTQTDAVAAINAVYAVYPVFYGSQNHYGVTELSADNVKIDRNATFIALDDWTLASDHPFVTSFWNDSYRLISRANIVISRVPKINMDSDLKNQILGEAYFIRAHAYFNLVRLFGAVPLHTTELQGADGISKPRTPVNDVYKLIIDDLNKANISLPVTRDISQFGRATKGASQAMLAWVNLTIKDYEGARKSAKDVIDSGKYQLLSDFEKVFNVSNETNNEIIFSIQYDGTIIANNLASFCHAFGTDNPNCSSGVQVFQVDMASSMWINRNLNEYRTANSVYDQLKLKNGIVTSVYTTTRPYPAFNKYNAPAEAGQGNCPLNPIVLRYPDVLFIYAEADNELSGPSSTSINMINQIIRRANKLPITVSSVFDISSSVSKDEFREIIIKQRNLEFIMEGKRIYDLLRLNRFKTTLKALGKPATAGDLFPIPLSEINANTALTAADQNPGY